MGDRASLSAQSPDSSLRMANAASRAERRVARQRHALRPLGWAVIVVVVVEVFGGHPAPGAHGEAAALTVAVVVFVASLALAISPAFMRLGQAAQTALIVVLAAGGVALLALQPKGASELAGGAAVWIAITRLPLAVGVALAAATTLALDVAATSTNSSSASVLATTLLCALLGLMAYFMRQARESQDRTEMLLAQLEDARDEQAQAAAIAERGRIASELHDVLAHSLSGAAIQLEGARMLAERDHAGEEMRAAIDRGRALVKDGLADARQAVGALRGERLPGVEQLAALIEDFRRDMSIDVSLVIEGQARALPEDAGLALYRGAQEALTNVARYAPAASTTVLLSYEPARARLRVEDRETARSGEAGASGALAGVGGGRGLDGMRERARRAGGEMRAGPTPSGWLVEIDVPA